MTLGTSKSFTKPSGAARLFFLPVYRQRCTGVYNEQVHAFLSMHESTIAAAKALAKAITDNGDLEEIRIYNLPENLADFLEDYEGD